MEQEQTIYEDFYLEDLEPWFGRVVVAPDESRFLMYACGTTLAFLAVATLVAVGLVNRFRVH